MDDMKYLNKLEVLINVFKVEDGYIKILLFKKGTEPYKGYWMLPSSLLFKDETIEHCAMDTMLNMVGYDDVKFHHVNVYSEQIKTSLGNVIGCSELVLIDSNKAKFDRQKISGFESAWFKIDEIPKTVGEHGKFIIDAIDYLKSKINESTLLNSFYPEYVTLKELHTLFEQLKGQSLDRRNFRKKALNSGLIVPTDKKVNDTNGRPAIYYKIGNKTNIFD